MCGKFVIVCAVLIAAVSGQSEPVVNIAALVNCSSTISAVTATQKCIDLYDIPITFPDLEVLANSTTSSTAILSLLQGIDGNTTAKLCMPENQENYISATLCVLNIAKKCASGSSVLQSLIPSPDKVRQQIKFQCQNIAGYNQDCVISKVEDIQKCVNISGIVSGMPDDTSVDDKFNRALCVSFELTRVCARKHLKACGESSVQLYEQSLPAPEGCNNYTDSNHGTDTEMKIDCRSAWGVRKSYLTCQVNSGIFIQIPYLDSSNQISEHIIKTITVEKSHEMCMNYSQYRDLVNCTLSVLWECTPEVLKTTLPYKSYILHGFEELCRTIDKYDAECVSNATSAAACEKQTYTATQDILDHICEDTEKNNNCLFESVQNCDETTSSYFEHQVSVHQLPGMCYRKKPGNSAFKPTVSAFLLIASMFVLH